MRARGINYDTGFLPGGQLSRKAFTDEAVRADMAVIARELHCDAVRVSGRDPQRLSVAAGNHDTFRDELRVQLSHGKPVAVLEFGTCAYRGAADRGGMAWQPPPDAVPDEEGIDTALWFTFADFTRTGDGDLGSYGVVRMLDDTRWQPKKVFHAMAARYGGPA